MTATALRGRKFVNRVGAINVSRWSNQNQTPLVKLGIKAQLLEVSTWAALKKIKLGSIARTEIGEVSFKYNFNSLKVKVQSNNLIGEV